jgi:putative PIN family toxin of toxin-antitoxin system
MWRAKGEPIDKERGITYDTIVRVPQIVIDTNVLVAALRSRRGASHRLLKLIGTRRFEVNLSVPLTLEYEAVAKRLLGSIPLTEEDVDDILDYLCRMANHWQIHYLWRPMLKDPADEMVLELAVTAACDFIVTYNKADFEAARGFGIPLVTAKEFLEKIGALT